jgi:hypothetical protein
MNYIKGLSNRQDFQKELKSFIHWFVRNMRGRI